jgi:hypothetical protein
MAFFEVGSLTWPWIPSVSLARNHLSYLGAHPVPVQQEYLLAVVKE